MKTWSEFLTLRERCWPGYKSVPGRKAYSPGSCKKEDVSESAAAAIAAATAIAKKKSGNYDKEGFRKTPYKNPNSPNRKSNDERRAELKEDLRKWFSKTDPAGDWKRINSKGEAIGPCAREPGEPKPKCMSRAKRESLTKKERASAVAAKRKHDPNPERKGEPINVSNFGKGKISEDMENLNEKNVPTNPDLWSRAKSLARSKFDVYPSAYANGWASKWYKGKGGSWKSVSEDVESLEEGRPSQRHPLEGHEYHKKSDEALIHIAKDAHAAAETMKSHNTTAENKYRDQANDSATVRHFRKTSGMPDWYKKKYGHMKEDVVNEVMDEPNYKLSIAARQAAADKSSAALRNKDAATKRAKIAAVMARRKMAKEEVESIDELSNDMLGRYKTAAGADASKADKSGDYNRGNKRFSGIVKATKKQFSNDMKKINEGFAETLVHKDKANAAYESGDSHAFHGHMVDHHVALADFHRQHGDEKSAQKHEDKAKEHHTNMQTYYREDIEHIDEKISVVQGQAPRQQGRFAPNNQIRTDTTSIGRVVSGTQYTGTRKPKPKNKKTVQEAKEKSEYDYEGDMARGQLQSIINNAQRVHDMLEDNDNLPEWVQSKITLAEDYISTVANYLMSEIDEEVKDEYARKVDRYLKKKYNKEKQGVAEGSISDLLNRDPKSPKFNDHSGPSKTKHSGSIPTPYEQGRLDAHRKKPHNNIHKDKQDAEDYNTGYRHVKSRQGVSEETLSELNKDTLHSYAKKSEKDQDDQFNKIGKGIRDNDPKSANKAGHKFSMRSIGQNRAEKRLAKEGVVEMSEGLVDKIKAIKRGLEARAKADDHFDKAGDPKNANASKDLKKAVRYHNLVNKEGVDKYDSPASETLVTKPHKEPIKKMKESKDNSPPFDGPYTKNKGTVTDKSGAKHTPMSRARDLARQAMKKQSDSLKAPSRLGEESSRKAEIVKSAAKKKKMNSKEDTFQSEPEISSTITKNY